MATRDFLYSEFENFDKPTEDHFKVLIDFAGEPTTFLNMTVEPTSDILTDLNLETFVIGVRTTYLIFYGAQVYILFGLEGTYGAGGLLIDNDHIALVGSKDSGALSESLQVTANIDGAGIEAGDSFPVGTTYEELFRQLLSIISISNLRYDSNQTSNFLRIGDTLNITKFLWTIAGEPIDLHLQDSIGQYSADVTGNQVTVTESYSFSYFTDVSWTLSGSNVDPITTTTYWVEPTYYGKNTTGNTPTATEILAGVELLSLTHESISVPIGTVVTEYGWIAVENTQTAKYYTKWEVSAINTADIGSNEFIKYVGNVIVNTKVYNIYIFNYMTQVNNIKLY